MIELPVMDSLYILDNGKTAIDKNKKKNMGRHNNVTSKPAVENQRLNEESFITLRNTSCFICNGFYGPCFEDPTCATCHAFLYPNIAPDSEHLSLLLDGSDDSDSGNDEPADNGYRPTVTDHRSLAISAPPVEVENLSDHLNRLTIPQQIIKLNIDHLPPEVLIYTFRFLDDISVWSVGQVNMRWRQVMNMFAGQDYWKTFTLLRWPLFQPPDIVNDWYEVYTALVTSSWCMKCLRQMAAQESPLYEESSWRKHRLCTELRGLRTDPPDGIQAKPLDSLYYHWQAYIKGPQGSPYEGGIFFLYIQIPYSYPMSPPLVRFLTKIFHPNVSRHGDIGIDSIHNNWSLALTISKVLISIQSLLTDPVCDVCMEPNIGKLYVNNKPVFEEQARQWTWKYAMHELLPY